MRAEKHKALILVGGPGSGKDLILRSIFNESNVTEIPLDRIHNAIILQQNLGAVNQGKPLVINGSARNDGSVGLIRTVLEEMGYLTKICVVTTTNNISKQRNDARINYGLKTISESVRESKWADSYRFIRTLDGTDAILFDNSKLPIESTNEIKRLTEEITNFFEESLDEAVGNFLDENLKNTYDSHKSLELSVVNKPKTGMTDYHAYNSRKTAPPTYKKGPKVTRPNAPVTTKPTNLGEAKTKEKKTTKPVDAPVSPQHFEGSDGAYLSTEAKSSFKNFRKQAAKPPTNTQYVGDPQGVGGATADLREEKKSNKSKSAKPPAINADARVGDDQAVVTTLGMTGESVDHQKNTRVLRLRKLREHISVKSPDGEFLEKEVYEDIGVDGEKAMYEGRAIVTNKPFKRGDVYSIYVDDGGVIEKFDFPNNKKVLQEIYEFLVGDDDEN